MSRSLVRTGLVAAASLFALALTDGAGQVVAPGASAGESQGKSKRRAQARRAAPQGYYAATPEEIARYFQLYGGYIDPEINKQSQGGPFDSGFFFDSGINRNGGDSPYMN